MPAAVRAERRAGGQSPAWIKSLTDILVDYELAARTTLPPAAFDYIAAGAGDELSLEESRAAWRRYRLRPRALRG